MTWSVLAWSALAVIAVMLAAWLVSLVRHDASVVDPVWPVGFVVVGVVAALTGRGDPLRSTVLVVLVGVWGLRLGAHLLRRYLHTGEDRRYAAMRERHGDRFPLISLVTVFATQGVLMWLVSLPLQLGAATDRRATGWAVLLGAGVLVWAGGFVFEAVGDVQLARFRRDSSTEGQVLDTGLWRYTRHPNYFGDACVWWGLFLVAAAAGGWAWVAVLGPVVMTIFLRRVSGVTLLERDMAERRPGYVDYVRRTSPFLPRQPRVIEPSEPN